MPSRRKRSRQELRALFTKFQSQRFPHQQRVVNKLTDNPRLLVYHSLGSGKTSTGLLAAQKLLKANPKDGNVLFVTPAGLTKNIEREQIKHRIKLPRHKVSVLSYDKAVRRIDDLAKKDHRLVVVDEAHKLRERSTKRVQALEPLLSKSKSVLLLSGSPMYHEPSNLSTLVNLLAKQKILPEDPKEFEERFIKSSGRLKNVQQLKNVLSKYVDFYEPNLSNQQQFYPKVKESLIKVPLSDNQQKVYRYLEEKLPKKLRLAVRNNLPLDKRDSAYLNMFSSGVRQVSNSTSPFIFEKQYAEGNKLIHATSNLAKKEKKDPNFRGLVYSNYLEAGVNHYKQYLDALKIPNQVISGALTAKQREEIVKNYNEGAIKVLLITSAGGEGLDLKGTKLVQVLDPHWNEEKINQVVGRAIRYKSHEHLPSQDRVVEVEHYLSTLQPTWNEQRKGVQPTSIDEYLYNRSKAKSQIHRQVKFLLQKQQ